MRIPNKIFRAAIDQLEPNCVKKELCIALRVHMWQHIFEYVTLDFSNAGVKL